MNKNKIIFFVVFILIILLILGLIKTNILVNPFSKHKKEVENYLKENYKGKHFKIAYNGSQKCIESSKCVKETVLIDSSKMCVKWKHKYKDDCMEYKYIITSDSDYFTITVTKDHGEYTLVNNSKKETKTRK